MASSPIPVLTIGHSTHSAEDFLALLRAHGVERLVDVRRFPGSRRYPHFGGEALEAALAGADIGYVHEPDLGGRRTPAGGRGRGAAPPSPNTAWRNASFRAYADHMASPEFQAALERVMAAAAGGRVALMCAEAVPWRCHRQLIADALVARGVEVRHILGPERADPHALRDEARVSSDGSVVYPGPEQAQRDLFAGEDGG